MIEKSVIRKNNAETAMTIHPRKSAVNLFKLIDNGYTKIWIEATSQYRER